MKQPEGHVEPGQELKVCRLVRSLYGLKQSGRCWNDKLDSSMKRQGFVRSMTDSSIYILKVNNHLAVLPVYIDDLPAISSSQQMRKYVKNALMAEFEVRYLGSLNTLLGIQFSRFPDGSLKLSQHDYILKLIKKYGMDKANPAPTPLDPNQKLCKHMGATEEELKEMETMPYRQLIGALSYIARATRFDIAFAVNLLAQFSSRPEPAHWVAVKRILRYLKGTTDQGLIYRSNEDLLHIYADASLASDRDDRKSYTGIAVMYGSNLVDWHATKQKAVACSTMEAEYRAIGHATKEALWARSLLTEIGAHTPSTPATKIFTDSTSAIAHAKSFIRNDKSKYIDITCHFVRERIVQGEIQLVFIPTKYNVADLFTKPHPGTRHRTLISFLQSTGSIPRYDCQLAGELPVAGEYVGQSDPDDKKQAT